MIRAVKKLTKKTLPNFYKVSRPCQKVHSQVTHVSTNISVWTMIWEPRLNGNDETNHENFM